MRQNKKNVYDDIKHYMLYFHTDVVVRFFLCFSLIQNTSRIMNTNVPVNAITAINGMRVLSMWWVILGHTYAFQQATPLSKYISYIADRAVNLSNCSYYQGDFIYILKAHGRVTSFCTWFAGNLLLSLTIIHRFTFQTVGNATFSVDSFFFLR